jgi:hypothetical protein
MKECKCSGSGDTGCCFMVLFVFLVFYRGCDMPEDIKAIRKALETQAAKELAKPEEPSK